MIHQILRRSFPCIAVLGILSSPVGAQPDTQPAPASELPSIPLTRMLGDSTSGAEPFPASPLSPGVGLTPTRTESPFREFGGSVTVIDAPQIVNSQQTYFRNLLQTTPGLDLAQNGGPGTVTSVFMRGQSSRATKVLVDGIPINDPSSPTRAFDFGSLNTMEIERVEVLRGPQSTLYGADAVGGVINIITKRGEGPMQGWISTMGGSYGTYEDIVHISGGTSQGYYSFGASCFGTTGFSQADRRYGRYFDTENDPSRQTTLSTRFGWTPAENFDVDVVLRYLKSQVALGSFNRPTPPFDPPLVTYDPLTSSQNEQFYGRVAARYALLDGDLEQRIAYNRFQVNRDFSDPNNQWSPVYALPRQYRQVRIPGQPALDRAQPLHAWLRLSD